MKKHIVCLGDSNTHGYCPDPADCADGLLTPGSLWRFNEEERWTCLLQKTLGEEYLVLEEGMSGRTTVFDDPLHEGMSALDVIYPVLKSHEPVALLIVMLGTNDTKERFRVEADSIAVGMERLCRKAETTEAWLHGKPNILVIAPPHIGAGYDRADMGARCDEKSAEIAKYYKDICARRGWSFLDAEGVAEFNTVDFMHLTRRGHSRLAAKLASLVPELTK